MQLTNRTCVKKDGGYEIEGGRCQFEKMKKYV